MSTLRTNTLSNAAGSKSVPVDTVVDGSAKAWVNFNGTGTVAIRAGFNVSSITDNGTGDYTVNFTTAMPNADYAAVCTGQRASGGATDGAYAFIGTTTYSAAAVQVRMCDRTGVVQDASIYNVAVFR